MIERVRLNVEPANRVGDSQPFEDGTHRTIHTPANTIDNNRRFRLADEFEIRICSNATFEIADIKLHAVVKFFQSFKIDVSVANGTELNGIAARLSDCEDLFNFIDKPHGFLGQILASLIVEVFGGVFCADGMA